MADITNQGSYTLRVDMEDYNGKKGHAIYAEFSVNVSDSYRLSLGEYLGTAGDTLFFTDTHVPVLNVFLLKITIINYDAVNIRL